MGVGDMRALSKIIKRTALDASYILTVGLIKDSGKMIRWMVTGSCSIQTAKLPIRAIG